MVGLWAGLGIALKHYFVLAPLALELWLVLKRRWAIRAELIALSATGLVYVATIYVVTPAYLHSVVPMIQESYGSFNPPFGSLLSSEILSVAAIALLGLALLPERSATVQSLGVAGLAFLVAFLLQRKGFHYHGLPAVGLFSAMAIVAIATKTRWDFRAKSAAFALGLVPLVAVATTFGHASRPHRPTLALFCDLPRGSTVLVLTPYGDVAWPAIEVCGQRWASRYMFLWMLHAINRDHDRHVALAKNLRRHIAQDIARYRPDLIIIERGRDRFGIDPLAFVMSDPTLRFQLADNYDRSLIPKRAIFRRKAAGQPPQAN